MQAPRPSTVAAAGAVESAVCNDLGLPRCCGVHNDAVQIVDLRGHIYLRQPSRALRYSSPQRPPILLAASARLVYAAPCGNRRS